MVTLRQIRSNLGFRLDATWRQTGVLTLFQLPLWIAALWIPVVARRAGFHPLTLRVISEGMVVVMALLLLWWLSSAIPAAINHRAMKRWNGPTARTVKYIETVFIVKTIIGEILQVLLGVYLWMLFLRYYVTTSTYLHNENRGYAFVFYLSMWVFVGLLYRGFIRAMDADYRDPADGQASREPEPLQVDESSTLIN